MNRKQNVYIKKKISTMEYYSAIKRNEVLKAGCILKSFSSVKEAGHV
jgi:hypothetical protein